MKKKTAKTAKTVKMNCIDPTATMVAGWQEVTPLISKRNKNKHFSWDSDPVNILTETLDVEKASKVRLVNKNGSTIVVSIAKFSLR
tara:strand:+ start:15941 stop:16198 length:258 start_codon:yes stop_codon:yes gene_type:complete